MANYQTGTNAITYNWVDVIGNTLDTASGFTPTSTAFFIVDTDGNLTEVTGTGFTYNAGAVSGGTVTGLQRFVGGSANGETISSASVDAATFWTDTASQKFAALFDGADTFQLSQNQLSGTGGTYALDAYGGSGNKILSEANKTSDDLVFAGIGGGQFLVDVTTGKSIQLANFNSFTGGMGNTIFGIVAQPGAVTLNGGNHPGTLDMAYQIASLAHATLDLSSDSLVNINKLGFQNGVTGGLPANAQIDLLSEQFGGSGLSSSLGVFGDTSGVTDLVSVAMTTSSLDLSGLTFDATWQAHVENDTGYNNGSYVAIDGTGSLGNLTITAPNTVTQIIGGSGSDTLQGGSMTNVFGGSTGNDTIKGGGGTNFVSYLPLATSGVVAIIQGGAGTVNKGGTNGIDHLTNISLVVGSTGSDVFYADANEIVNGDDGFNYLIELTAGVNLSWGTNFGNISEFVSDTGNNTIDFSNDPDIAYVYGSTGNDTLTLGTGGGYLFGEGGTNLLDGATDTTNVFEGGSGGANTMNGGGGTASNYYYVSGTDHVTGAGAFNEVIELDAGVTAQIGGSQYQHVQEFVANSGANTVSVAGTDSDFIYLYGGSGNDTLTTGSGGGYLIGEGGTNVLTGGGGLNVFVADNASGVDMMNGGSGSNVYYIDNNSTVQGNGTFNTVVELQQNASLTLGSAALNGVQEVVFNGGTNLADFHAATGAVFLYGGSGNDTLYGGTGSDFLYGGLGANTFTFGMGWGKDTIEDWTAGTNDIIDLTALAGSGVHAITDLTQTISGGKDVITSSHTGTNSITLLGVGTALTASSFHFM